MSAMKALLRSNS